MTWEEICEHPSLRDLPFKIEQDRYGRVVMSPADSHHGRFQAELIVLFRRLLPEWTLFSEAGVATAEGVRVPDVSAMSPERAARYRRVASLKVAPEICVEIASPSNAGAELEEKRALLAQRGCVEFWVCSEEGEMAFWDAERGVELGGSRLCPQFPKIVDLG